MWKRKTVAVILPTTKIKNSTKDSVLEFDSSGYVDEIIVIDNNKEKNFEEEVNKTRAHYIAERRPGHGRAIRTGLDRAKADILIVVEPDGTFNGKDVTKLLAYMEDFDIVFGSRTHVRLIETGSGMTFLRRVVNSLFGKFITYLYLCPPITDPGCIMRATTKKAWRKVASDCKSDGDIFVTEWLLVAAKNKINYIDIPVNFRAKKDRSYLDTNFLVQAWWALVMFIYIWKIWFLKLLSL